MSELIYREATVKQICKIGEMVGGHDRDVVISIALFVQDDKTAFPTVERPYGEWIKTGRTNIYGGFEIECSHCHNKLMVSPKRWEVGENFCDVCGSRNKREGEAE